MHLQNPKCTQAPTSYAPHKLAPVSVPSVSVSSLIIILSPKAAIFGLPLTAFIMAQTDLKASKVHFSFKHLWRILFCCVVSLASVMVLWSPLSIMSASIRSKTIFSASISSINWPRNWPRTSSAAWRGQNLGTPTSQHPMYCRTTHSSIVLLINGNYYRTQEANTDWVPMQRTRIHQGDGRVMSEHAGVVLHNRQALATL